MIDSCNKDFSDVNNLSLVQLDTTNDEQREKFLEAWRDKISLITSFNCLHWVEDMPTTIKFLSDLLKHGGKFVGLIPTKNDSSLNPVIRVFNEVLQEEEWSEKFAKVETPLRMANYRNNSWMKSNKDQIDVVDFQKLIESHGFMTEQVKDLVVDFSMRPELMVSFVELATSLWDVDETLKKQFIQEFRGKAIAALTRERPDPENPAHVVVSVNMFRIMAIHL